MSKRTMACRTCGSDRVVRDAWAYWALERQEWDLGNLFDYAFCLTCESECTIQEMAAEATPRISPAATSTESLDHDHS